MASPRPSASCRSPAGPPRRSSCPGRRAPATTGSRSRPSRRDRLVCGNPLSLCWPPDEGFLQTASSAGLPRGEPGQDRRTMTAAETAGQTTTAPKPAGKPAKDAAKAAPAEAAAAPAADAAGKPGEQADLRNLQDKFNSLLDQRNAFNDL